LRQVLQSLKTGAIELVEAPAPLVRDRHLLIETQRTLISAGTERMLLQFGRANLVQKALQQPARVKEVVAKARTDGVAATLEAVRAKLDQPIPLGYCNAGVIRELGRDAPGFRLGDRVVSNGPHAELIVVGRNLAARIPDGVDDDAACFAPLAAVALQGCRLAAPSLGETFCVMGLGLVGLMAVQLLRAHGCRVLGADFARDRLELAGRWGAETIDLGTEDPVERALSATGGLGVDGVLIAASTDSNDPVSQAARMSRQRGRLVLVGVTGLILNRAEFYDKELSFQVSCSYGPGRYDAAYEEGGHDYPYGLVRWTEQRNFEAVLAEMACGRLEVKPLISSTVDIGDAAQAYEQLAGGEGGGLGLVLAYSDRRREKFDRQVGLRSGAASHRGKAVVALIGAGGFGGRVTAPGLKQAGASLKTIVSRGGVSSVIEGRKAGFENASTDVAAVMANSEIDTIVIATRHDSHAQLTLAAIDAGKHVFVEKPLALTEAQLDLLQESLGRAAAGGRPVNLMVGFNRRFSPYATKARSLLAGVAEPKCLVAIVNAGSIPADHWTQDPAQGGGRIVGEACHFIDLLRFLVASPIVSARVTSVGPGSADGVSADKTTITLAFHDGSIGTVHYFANGPKSVAKERIEMFAGGKWLRIDNFRRLEGAGWSRNVSMSGRQDKGHEAALRAFVTSIQEGSAAPIPPDEIFEVSRWSVRAAALSAG
jgi:predicted dehydrogenase/threonine dehydrogenase-like Zn-dependent dehydrogenase